MQGSGKPVVLIVDDTPTNIQVLAEALRTEYRVKVAGGGLLALEAIARQGPPDLVLLDVMMPDLDGYEVCRRLKQDPRTRHVPVIFVTAKSEAEDEERGLNLGAVDYVTKPFHLSIVLARIRNHIQLKRQADLLERLALLDGLTGIANRRRFDETLVDEWKRAERSGEALALIMLDIDHFKLFNDHYGHGAGDDCLRRVAAVMQEEICRPGDLAARYGGEEFVALLPATEGEGARAVAGRLRARIEALHLPHSQSPTSTWVTASLGVASCRPQRDRLPQTLTELADRMLYQAKAAGRNRLILAPTAA